MAYSDQLHSSVYTDLKYAFLYLNDIHLPKKHTTLFLTFAKVFLTLN